MRELSETELEDVSGGVGPVLGGFLSGASYLAISGMTGQGPTFAGFAGSFAFGAVTSGFNVIGGSLTGAAKLAREIHSTGLGSLAGSATYNSVGGMSSQMSTGSHIMDKHK